jgi:hypothetical protein
MKNKFLEKAGDLISGKLKKSKSYHNDYADKTYEEILDLARSGDQKARHMKKLIEQSERLRRKVRGK